MLTSTVLPAGFGTRPDLEIGNVVAVFAILAPIRPCDSVYNHA